MKEIPLTRGLVALVDDADYDAVARELYGQFAKTNEQMLEAA